MQELGDMTKIAKKLVASLRSIDDIPTRENVGYVLTRINNIIATFKTTKDPSGKEIPKLLAGEYLLKTYRIAREPDILELIRKNLPSDFNHYSQLCKDVFAIAKFLLGDRYDEFYGIEQETTKISLYLFWAWREFSRAATMEPSTQAKMKIDGISRKFRDLAYLIYNGSNPGGKYLSYRRIIPKVEDVWVNIQNIKWEEFLSESKPEQLQKLKMMSEAFINLLSRYTKWAARGGDDGEADLQIDVMNTSVLWEFRWPVVEFTESEARRVKR